jgi:DNA-binding PadR family transcriptional regulator
VEIVEGEVPRYRTTAKGERALGHLRELRRMIHELGASGLISFREETGTKLQRSRDKEDERQSGHIQSHEIPLKSLG